MFRKSLLILPVLFLLATGSAVAAEVPNYLVDSRVGEWVTYEIDGAQIQRTTVTGVADGKITIKNETIEDGKVVETEEDSFLVADGFPMDLPPDAPEPKITSSTVEIKGGKMPCVIVEMIMEPMTMRAYLSKEVPILGLIKMEMVTNGQTRTIIDLKDYGF